ncbi:unnamed protein product [Pedinophyceae sp. YPF-701]|nr:unnamed protein product [Pedinophyceae sp. YPF-701]
MLGVEIPGYVDNPGNVMRMLGGAERVHYALTNDSCDELPFIFRPDDPFSHPLVGDKQPTCSFLLRLSVPANAPPGTRPAASLAGRIAHVVRYTGIADFQYGLPNLPPGTPHRPPLCNDAVLAGLPSRADPKDPFATAGPVPLMAVPPVFARVEPSSDFFREVAREEQRALAAGKLRGVRAAGSTAQAAAAATAAAQGIVAAAAARTAEAEEPAAGAAASGGAAGAESDEGDEDGYLVVVDPDIDAVPPANDDAGVHGGEGGVDDAGLEAVAAGEAAFAERPVWSVAGLRAHVRESEADVEWEAVAEALGSRCYRFGGGPWEGLWVRRGYDPRGDPEARWWQRVAIRLQGDLDAEGGDGLWEELGLDVLTQVEPTPEYVVQVADLRDPELQGAVRAGVRGAVHPARGWLTDAAAEAVEAHVRSVAGGGGHGGA